MTLVRTPGDSEHHKALRQLAAQPQYELTYVRFEAWCVFYCSVWGEITYQTGEKRYFWGKGGGLGVGGGIYVAGGPPTYISKSPSEILGDSGFVFSPLTIGAQVSFSRNGAAFATLVGAGVGSLGVFGGNALWTKEPQVDAHGQPL